jgi:glucose/arabinose dehydrogenase
MDRGQIVTLPDKRIVASGLNTPHGFMFDNCSSVNCTLYVAEVNALWQFEYPLTTKQAVNKQKLTDLPIGGRHFTRYLLKDPNNPNRILISIGSTCDVCVEKNPMNGSIQSFDLTTKELKPYVTGLRNSVFLTQRPNTTEIWATEMGRDHLGDNLPPDEINILKEGLNYGWPYCYGQNITDTNFQKDKMLRCGDGLTEPSHIDLPAHSAPLGLTFIPSNSQWPEKYWGNLLVAYHGSWNRSEPTGYKIVRITLDKNGKKISEEDFISGWLDGNSSLGRPVDLLATGDGKLYISDDKAGVIYLLKKVQ